MYWVTVALAVGAVLVPPIVAVAVASVTVRIGSMRGSVQMLLPAITQGMRGVDDLTNYVYAITNYWGLYGTNGTLAGTGVTGLARATT